MANELTVSASLSFSKAGIAVSASKTGLLVTVAGDAYVRNIQTIGTSEEAIVLGDSGSAGYCFLRNLDATNYVTIRPGTGTADLIKLQAGEIALFRLAVAPWAIANTGACQLEVVIIEN
jgi:hypothetical protein